MPAPGFVFVGRIRSRDMNTIRIYESHLYAGTDENKKSRITSEW